jgi:hypothetical protein
MCSLKETFAAVALGLDVATVWAALDEERPHPTWASISSEQAVIRLIIVERRRLNMVDDAE